MMCLTLLIATLIIVSCLPAGQKPVVVEKVVPAVQVDSEVAAIVEKSSSVTNYKYLFSSKIRNRVELYDEKKYDVYVANGVFKKVYSHPLKFQENIYYDQVYIDPAARTAVGICAAKGVSCEGLERKSFIVSYDAEKISLLPLDLLHSLPPQARKTGKELVDDRQASIIEYPVTGGKEKISVDDYSGIPLKWDVLTVNGDEETLQQEFTFTQLVVGNIKQSDITLPAGYALQG